MQFWVLGNPENRRVTFFSEAAVAAGYAAPRLISYETYLNNNCLPEPPAGEPVCLRLDSPGENAAVRKALIRSGLQNPQTETVDELVSDHGRIGLTAAWYSGFSRLLRQVALQAGSAGLAYMNHPAEIELLFNKRACHAQMRAHGVPVPDALPPVRTYEELRAAMRAAGMKRVFIKPAHASSASGVIAFRAQGDRVEAISSAELVRSGTETRLYNSLKLQTYRDEKTIALLADAVLAEVAIAEQWIPKATLHGRSFDLRVLVIAGKAQHLVVRTGHSVITNLHLGNRRGDETTVYNRIGPAAFERLLATAEGAAACFPRSLYIGVDLLLANDYRSAYVMEANAFGDLLPGILHEGHSTYAAEITAFSLKHPAIPAENPEG